MQCPSCGHENREGALFCRQCGGALAQEIVCPGCGASNPTASKFCDTCGQPLAAAGQLGSAAPTPALSSDPTPAHPTVFAGGRYEVKRFLGEGGKKQVYLAHDTLLDRDVAFALIKIEGLDEVGRQRIQREAQAMGRLGAHPHIVSVFDLGQEGAQPYIVTELMGGGDVEGLIEKAPEHRLPIERALQIGIEACQGLEFAHEKGVVHRDLKPGNVWLTSDGRAKLGDFGLAVAVDRSRLTQAGMMVGTVSYMPPEQATGGEIGPRSDLYSLGCMLYEMVCGRPPFVGDESVAIIGQHLNTPPVAPSWHRPDLPPALEVLVLRLLEKDATRRPASATEVRQALDGVARSPGAASPTIGDGRSVGGAAASPAAVGGGAGERATSDPLYRRTFVGRESELKQLQTAFDAALAGQGALAMVVGEPGIGKTSVCEQLATYATLRGGKVLVGHCYEEGSLSLPYLPFVEAMRSYVLTREPDELRKDLGSGASEVARIVAEVRDKVQVSPSEGGDPEEQRWRLLQAVTGFLRNASQVQPLLLILEDLHDADRGTLDLLMHLSRTLQGARLLVVGTYRDVEVDRAHPLSGALAELRRGGSFLRVPLRGLTVDEVQRMMSIIRGQEVPWSRAEVIHRQTEGNPLFVQEVLRYLVEEGLVVREGERYVLKDDAIPEGLRDVIGKRLSRLSDKANQVLSVASVIGREFRLDVLQRVAGLSEDEVIEALEEARGRAVIEERGATGSSVLTFRFTHAFFRQTLYEEIFSARRIRWHQQVARALEAVHARRLDEHAAELAEHFAYSSDPADLRKAVEYGELAAKRAVSVYAHGEAVRHLEQALKAQEVLDPDDKLKRCDLLLDLGEALLPAAEAQRALEIVAEEAFGLAEAQQDAHRASLACQVAWRALYQVAATSGPLRSRYSRLWEGRADRSAAAGTLDRVRADLSVAFSARIDRGDEAQARMYSLQAFELARQLGDAASAAEAAWPLLVGAISPPEHHEERLRVAEAIAGDAFTGLDTLTQGNLLQPIAWVYLTWGDRRRAEALWVRLKELAERSHDAQVALLPLENEALRQTLDGDLTGALETASRIVTLSGELGRESAGLQAAGRASRRALLYLGRPAEVLPGIAEAPHLFANGGVLAAQRAMFLAHAGRPGEAEDILTRFKAERDFSNPEDPTSAAVLRYLLEASVLVEDRALAAAVSARFTPLAGLLHTERSMVYCIGRLLGGAAKLLGRPEEAQRFYMQGLEACERVHFRPEIALSRLELAELFLEHFLEQRATAIEHLDFAIAELRAMKMQPFLERALRHRGLLKA